MLQLTENTTLSTLGATPAQIKAIYTRGAKFSRSVPDASAKFERHKSKGDLSKAFKGVSLGSAVIFVLKKNKNVVLFTSHGREILGTEIAPDGKIVDETFNERISAVLKSLGRSVAAIYSAPDARVNLSSAAAAGSTKANNDTLARNLADLISKRAQALFTAKLAELADESAKSIRSGDIAATVRRLRKIADAQFKSGEYTSVVMDVLATNTWSGNNSMYDLLAEILNGARLDTHGYFNKVYALTANSSSVDLRKAGADLLRFIKETLDNL